MPPSFSLMFTCSSILPDALQLSSSQFLPSSRGTDTNQYTNAVADGSVAYMTC